ncbi:unnamed protein product, partial [Protopolystoma xenopodis]
MHFLHFLVKVAPSSLTKEDMSSFSATSADMLPDQGNEYLMNLMITPSGFEVKDAGLLKEITLQCLEADLKQCAETIRHFSRPQIFKMVRDRILPDAIHNLTLELP